VRGVRAQYFISFGLMGAVLPFLSVFLKERGLSNAQVGYVTAAAGFGVLLTPVFITLLADAAIAGRVLMFGIFASGGLLLIATIGAEGFWPIIICYSLHALAMAPVVPLQDGIYFSAAAREQRPPPYHVVRVWGTFGYILPSVVLYFFLTGAGSVSPALACGVAMCALGAINALLVLPAGTVALDRSKALPTRVPTFNAVAAMLEPHVLVFCIAMALVHMAAASYYQLYPLHLTDNLGIGKQWVGLIANIGVVVEIAFMLGFGWLTAKLTLRGLMIAGVGCIALRFVLLALVPTPAIAIGTQVLHGMMVLVLHVAPPIYLNGRARDAYRNSIQGMYAMLVSGAARIIGSAVAGIIAERSIGMAFAVAAGLCVIATGLFWFAFREEPARDERAAEQPLDAPAAA